ncbi:MAG: YchJ family protein [Sulfurimonas sp.]|nr:YchJ family protein [Sulfurimonas sp.]MDD5201548.1 YchJ family protein [Sulfurimonas sp.]
MHCFCGNEQEFELCCGTIIAGKREAKTPEELMRSRYSAYVKGDARYLLQSTVKENRYAEDIELIEEFSNAVEWLGLEVLFAKEDIVAFKAFYRDAEGIKVLHEESKFVQEDALWRYKDGILYNTKVQRNDACPCGSGKKYKKCCA